MTSGGKELCDLLSIFGNDVLIFSDKESEFPNTGDLHLDWARWFGRTVSAAAKQAFGAERWIRSRPDRVFNDQACSNRFVFLPTNPDSARYRRIVVARGAAARCAAAIGGLGTLSVDPDIEGPAHTTRKDLAYRPFSIGDIDPKRPFVHVFDELSIELVLSELDTIRDLVGYLDEREAAVRSKRLYWARGEEDLLAVYLSHSRETGEHFIPEPDSRSRLWIEVGAWADLNRRDDFRRKKRADRESYVWDTIVAEFAAHSLSGTLLEGDRYPAEVEPALRVMAAENRFQRRMLGAAIAEKMKATPRDMIGVRFQTSPSDAQLTYVFVVYPDDGTNGHEYRRRRRAFLEDYCLVYSSQNQSSRILGIATESGLGLPRRSHDLLYLHPRSWSDADLGLAREIQAHRKILRDDTLRETHRQGAEFPPE